MIVGVVPAAGHGTRLQPLACSKEVLPVLGRPVIEHVFTRLEAGRADEIRVVTRAAKRDVVELAERRGAAVVLGEPATVPASVALGLAGLDRTDIVLVGFPDTLWEPVDAFRALIAGLESCDAVVGVFRSREPDRGDVVELAGGRVERIHVKTAEPPGNLVWGCLAARASALEGIGRCREISDHLRTLDVRAVVFDSEFLDVGTRASLAAVEATT